MYENSSKDYVLAGFIVAAGLAILLYWVRVDDPAAAPAPSAAEATTSVQDSAPQVLDSDVPAVAHAPSPPLKPVTVNECMVDGQKVYTDRPCEQGGSTRTLDVGQLNTYGQPAVPLYRSDPRPTSVPQPASVMAQPQPIPPTAGGNDWLCAQIQAALDRLDAAMRQGYTSQEGERFREQWHRLKNQYHEAGCRDPER